MAQFTFTYTDLKNKVNGITHGKASALVLDSNSMIDAISSGVKSFFAQVDLRSSKRRQTIAPGLYTEVYSYPLPSDTKGMAVADIIRQVNRKEEWFLTDVKEFDRGKTRYKSMLAIDDRNGFRVLRLATGLGTKQEVIDSASAITLNGSTAWVASGNATNLRLDSVNYVDFSSSLEFDTSGAAPVLTRDLTSAQFNGVAASDLTPYYNSGSIFAWVHIPSVTSAPTFTLKWGSASTAYWQKSVTATHEGLSFYAGWNLLRFDWPTSASAGSPSYASVKYIQFSATGCDTANAWRLNAIVARLSDIHDILYYTKYPWQDSSTNAYKANPTSIADFIVADDEEIDMIAQFCGGKASQELRNKDAKDVQQEAKDMIENYKMSYPSERILYQTTYEHLATLEGDYDVGNGSSYMRSKA